jgi:hypothetical protein
VQRDTSPPSAHLPFFTPTMLLALITNCEPHGMKVQIVNPYRVSHLQRYGVMVHGNITSVYPPLAAPSVTSLIMGFRQGWVFLLALCSPATYGHDFTCTLILEMV